MSTNRVRRDVAFQKGSVRKLGRGVEKTKVLTKLDEPAGNRAQKDVAKY